jgi:hypothetical protein
MPAWILDIDYADQYDFALIGVASSQREHRVVWSVNCALGWSLERTDDLTIQGKSGTSVHARFVHRMPEDHATFTFLTNRGDGGWLLPERAQFDYLIKVEEEFSLREGSWCRELRQAKFINAALELPLDNLKSIHQLIIT